MLEVLLLYLIIPGRINFLQLGRYGKYSEQRYRQQFEAGFDWLSFNSSLVKSHLGSRLAIAFDPSYISKSGKCTPYLGRFWSGCAGKAKHGLEISGIGVIDLDLRTCLHLEAVQTPAPSALETVDWTLVPTCITCPQRISFEDNPLRGCRCLFLQSTLCERCHPDGLSCH